MTDRMKEAGSQTKGIGPDRRRLELASDPGELIDRIGKLGALLPAFAQETAAAAVKWRACGRRTQRCNAASSSWKTGPQSLAN